MARSAGPRREEKLTKKQVDGAVAVIGELSTDWDPQRYEDCYRARLRRVIDAKRKRKKIAVPEPSRQPWPAADLMEALERTLDEVRSR